MSLEVIILAAGQGTRMKSALPKVLHLVAGRPLLAHVVATAQTLNPAVIHVVTGHAADQVQAAMAESTLNWVLQTQQLGTGHAVAQALPMVAEGSTVLVLYGDVPLISQPTLAALLQRAESGLALLTAVLADPSGYGRVLRGENGAVLGVVEEKDATDSQRQIREVNTGVLAAPAAQLRHLLPRVGNANQQGEYYLPDILGLQVADGNTVEAVKTDSELEILGVNDRVQLNQVEREYQRRVAETLLRAGVSIADAQRLDVRGELICGEDVSIDVNVVFEGKVSLGNGVRIGPNCVLRDVSIGDGVTIQAMSHLDSAVIGDHCTIGPYARLRPGTVLEAGARIGNFVEIKKSTIGRGSKVNHLSYIGDCTMGDEVNIGAGTITCNYDGSNKFQTDIGAGSFVGSNATLVAPLDLARDSFVAAGSTITRPVGPSELAVGRGKQRNIQGWQRPRKTDDRD